MTPNKQREINQIKLLYLLIFILGSILIAPTHLFPPPSFMHARFPYYLETMGIFLGVSWPITFEVYHYVLYALAIIGTLNVLGIILYPKIRKIALISSLAGMFLITIIILFLFLQFIKVNPPTAIIYGLYLVVLLIVNILTFKTLTRHGRV